jgi:transposase InsO family protein
LTVFSRQVLVNRVTVEGWPAAEVARQFQISRSTAYKWLQRFREEGAAGLEDRSSRPHRSPRALARAEIEAILHARTYRKWGPHRIGPLTGHPRSTVYGILRRAGVSRLDGLDRPTGIPLRRRYVADRPGALLHQDHKQLVRVPAAGWRPPRGNRRAPGTHLGYDHLEVFVDDRTRIGWAVPVDGERPIDAVRALERAARFYASLGIRIERVLTDNGSPYISGSYAQAVTRLGIRHTRTRPRRPQTNGKVERLIGTLLREWAYGRPYRSNDDRFRALFRYLDFYNRRRPHTALEGLSPLTYLSTT